MNTLTDEEKVELVRLYRQGTNMDELSHKFNLSKISIRKLLQRRGVFIPKRARKYSLDETIFDDIDTEEKAYWLGFIMGDGSVRNHCSLRLELSSIDETHLMKFRDFLKSNYPIKKTRKDCSIIEAGSKRMCIELERHGIVSRKTYLRIKTPKIHAELLKHFYRGLLDADGWITEHKSKTQKPGYDLGFSSYYQDILIEIKNWASSIIGKEVGSVRTRIRGNQQVSQLIIGGRFNFLKLGEIFYKDSTIYLDRKFDKYNESKEIILQEEMTSN